MIMPGGDRRGDRSSGADPDRPAGRNTTAVMTETTRFRGTTSYLTNEALEAAVNCALALQKPLLVRASPAPARRCSPRRSPRRSTRRCITWHVKSTTRAQDGLYVYDTVQRLYDSRFGDGDVTRHPPLHQARAARARRSRRSSAWCC